MNENGSPIVYKQIYHIGIIDFLQDWSVTKRMENFIKSMSQKKGELSGHSAVPPHLYQMRFQDFITKRVLKPAIESFQDGTTYTEYKEIFIKQLLI
jgi:hypothetical protein